MPNYVVISRENHGNKKWRRFTTYNFAATEAAAPLVGAEFAKAAVSMPIAFLEQGGRYIPVAVLSLEPGRNMFVGRQGQWLGHYVPAVFRSYPFRLLRKDKDSQEWLLTIDEDSKLVVDSEGDGETFYDADGNPSVAIKAVFNFLVENERSRAAAETAVAVLASAGLIQPLQIQAGQSPRIGGLHSVDQGALNALDDESFLQLRKSGALSLAYAQMLSVGRFGLLQRLALVHSQSKPTTKLPDHLDSLFGMADDQLVRFD